MKTQLEDWAFWAAYRRSKLLGRRYHYFPVIIYQKSKQVSSINGPLVLTVQLFTLFWVKYKFSFKIPNRHFHPLSNTCHQVTFQKNLMNRFRGNFKKDYFGLKNDPFSPFSTQSKFSSKILKKYIHPFLIPFLRYNFKKF